MIKMGMMYGNGSFKGGIDAAVLAYIGDSTLTTSADNLGDAINEHEEDISGIKSNLTDLETHLTQIEIGHKTGAIAIDFDSKNTDYSFLSLVLLFTSSSNTYFYTVTLPKPYVDSIPDNEYRFLKCGDKTADIIIGVRNDLVILNTVNINNASRIADTTIYAYRG